MYYRITKLAVLGICILFFGIQSAYGQFPDRHSTDSDDGWRSCSPSTNPNPLNEAGHWITFDFQEIMQLGEVYMWNVNEPENTNMGISDFKVDYSLDGSLWEELGIYNLDISPGSTFYEGQLAFDFEGLSAQYVLISVLSNQGGTCTGFDEIRFYLGSLVPLELLSFQAECQDKSAHLTWEVGQMNQVESISVERSHDGTDWRTIESNVSISSTNNGVKTYEYNDIELGNDRYYYRLKISDTNGKYEYSPIETVNCGFQAAEILIYPNPVQNKLYVNLENMEYAQIPYTIVDLLGRQVASGALQNASVHSQGIIDMTSIPQGMYVINFGQGDFLKEYKLIKTN